MEKFVFIDLNKLTWQLDVAIAGGIFSIFSLIYRPEYIYYGLLTFAFGVVGHVIYLFWEWIFCFKHHKTPDKIPHYDPFYPAVHLTNLLLSAYWLYEIHKFYF